MSKQRIKSSLIPTLPSTSSGEQFQRRGTGSTKEIDFLIICLFTVTILSFKVCSSISLKLLEPLYDLLLSFDPPYGKLYVAEQITGEYLFNIPRSLC